MGELKAKIQETATELKLSATFRDELERIVCQLSVIDLALSSTKIQDALETREANGIATLLNDISDKLKTLIKAK